MSDPTRADLGPGLSRLLALRVPLLVGGGGLVALSLLGLLAGGAAWFTAYLVAWLCWVGVAVGCLALVMIHWITGGEWGLPVRRTAEAAALTMPLLAVGFLPIALGGGWLYPWGRPALVAASDVLQHQRAWMNAPFVLARGLVYFGVWWVLALLVSRGGLRYDVAKDGRVADRTRGLSAFGMVLLVLTVSLASVDWIMVRQEAFTSTIFGFLVAAGWGLSGFAFAVAVLPLVWRAGRWDDAIRPPRRIDLGNLLMACVLLVTYMSAMQFIIIWMGNTEAGAAWYIARGLGQGSSAWRWCGLALIALEMLGPFVLLLQRPLKLRLASLAGIAAGVLVVSRVLDTAWMAGPSSVPGAWSLWDLLLVPTLFAGLGAIWVAAWATLAARRPMDFLMVERPLSDFRGPGPEGRRHGNAASPLG